MQTLTPEPFAVINAKIDTQTTASHNADSYNGQVVMKMLILNILRSLAKGETLIWYSTKLLANCTLIDKFKCYVELFDYVEETDNNLTEGEENVL